MEGWIRGPWGHTHRSVDVLYEPLIFVIAHAVPTADGCHWHGVGACGGALLSGWVVPGME